MKLLGLKGFTSWGRIDSFFTEGCFPNKFNWTSRDVDFVREAYTKQYGNDEYVVITYSDGGTVGHRLLLTDPRCVGLAAVGSVFPSHLERYLPLDTAKYMLLTNNKNDITGMARHTKRAYDFYKRNGFFAVYTETKSSTWHGHDFAPSLNAISQWAQRWFGWDLPVAQ